jgi:hypothetical protein
MVEDGQCGLTELPVLNVFSVYARRLRRDHAKIVAAG